jgi:putative SOS response-associated peptidase YedK
MCGRYAIFGPASASREAKEAMDSLGFDIVDEINKRDDQFNVAPTQKALVVARNHEGRAEAKMLRWGLVPSWAKDDRIGSKLVNARAETVAEKPSFRTAFKKRRCLVPASGYFEWKGEAGHKQPYFIHDPNGTVLFFAGLWEGWKKPDDDWLHTFTVVTGAPGKVSGDIHDRQPVILPPDLWEVWLDGTPAEASATLAVAPEATLRYHAVPKAVGSPRNNGPELVEPIEPDEAG